MVTPSSVTLDTKVSDHFKVGEFCKDPRDLVWLNKNLTIFWPRLLKLCAALEKIRNKYGVPVHITSGVRDPAHNAEVGGVADSQHCKARAADIVIAGVSPAGVGRFARGLSEVGGVGVYPTQGFTHVDVRDRSGGPVATWEG